MKYEMIDTLNKLSSINPDLRVQSFISFPATWIRYRDIGFDDYVKEYGFPNHREILETEVVIDVDTDIYEDGFEHADLIEKRLHKKFKNIGYERHESGGDGQHFHFFFNDLKTTKLLKDYSLKDIKNSIIKILVGKRLMKYKSSHICMHNKTLIQLEYADHRKGGVKKLLSRRLKVNTIPKEVKELLNKSFLTKEEYRKKIENIPKTNEKYNCIKFFLGETIKGKKLSDYNDGLYRITFSLVNYYKRKGLNNNEIFDEIIKWKSTLSKNWVENSNWKIKENTLKYMINNSTGHAGCNFNSNILSELNVTTLCKDCPYDSRL